MPHAPTHWEDLQTLCEAIVIIAEARREALLAPGDTHAPDHPYTIMYDAARHLIPQIATVAQDMTAFWAILEKKRSREDYPA
jgi:hypothetical protein